MEAVVADFQGDQAAGLRRLLGAGQLQAITFVAGCEGVAKSIAVANIGAALARLGKEVLIVDEHTSSDNVASLFGMSSNYDLLNVVQHEATLPQVLLQPLAGLRILQASRAVRKLGRLSAVQQQALLTAMARLDHPVDVILVDAAMSHPQGFSPFGLASRETVVVVSGNSASITEAYALIKKISQAYARKHFRILVNKVRSQPDARSIFDNIAQVAIRRGIAQLDYVGAVPHDEAVKMAGQFCRPVVVQLPDSAASIAFREMAADMLHWGNQERDAGGVEQFMQQLLHLSQRVTPNQFRV